eukprot:160654-Chlamydomonas_euryale.AAC.5
MQVEALRDYGVASEQVAVPPVGSAQLRNVTQAAVGLKPWFKKRASRSGNRLQHQRPCERNAV